jgi:hypothetical protein
MITVEISAKDYKDFTAAKVARVGLKSERDV